MTRIAVIGLGNMGGAVARRMNECFKVIGFDQSRTAREHAQTLGVATADSLGDAVNGTDIVITSLPNDTTVRTAWLGQDGVLEHAPRGAVAIEISTITPTTMRELADLSAVRGIDTVDSPVSGGPNEATEGKLSLFVGGDATIIEGITPILGQIGSIKRTGDVGTGKVVKIVNNMMSMANVLAASEAFSLGVAAGVSPQRLYDILSDGGATSHHFTKRWPKALSGDFAPGFTVSLGEKDLALGIELARSIHRPSPVAETGREIYEMAMRNGYADNDIVALLKFYESWQGEGKR